MSEIRTVSNKMILCISLFCFVFLLVIWFVMGIFQQSDSYYEQSLAEGWTSYVNGEKTYDNEKILSIRFNNLKVNDVIDLYVTVPDYLDGGYTVEMLVYLCSFEAYVDDELVYSYGKELIGKNVMVGSGYHFINLPKDAAGKELHIQMIINERNAFTNINTPKCIQTDNAIKIFARERLITLLIGMFLVTLGVILVMVSMAANFFNKIYIRLFFIGSFSFLMGLWTLLSNKVWQVFAFDRMRCSEFEYMFLYFAPVPFGFLMYHMRREDKKNWRRTVVGVMSCLLTLFAVLSTLLHYTNILRYPSTLVFFHAITFISIIFIVFAGYITVGEKTNSETVTAVAMFMCIAILALDLGRFNLQKYVLPKFNILMNSFIPLGTLVFVILLLVSYLIYMYDMAMSKAEKDALTNLAYNDVLTGLYNRTKYEAVMAELDQAKDNFAIISIDLNDLKYVNDTYGHDKGDLMLTTFAKILRLNFGSLGRCFRTGGDEYIVIVEQKKINGISHAIADMIADEEKASKTDIFEINASYGVAYRSEIEDGQAFKVFRLADRRMYEMKSREKGKEYVFGKALE